MRLIDTAAKRFKILKSLLYLFDNHLNQLNINQEASKNLLKQEKCRNI